MELFQQTLKELFDEPSGLKELAEEEEQKEKQQQQQRESRRRHERRKDKGKEEKCEEEKPADSSMSQEQIEQVSYVFPTLLPKPVISNLILNNMAIVFVENRKS